MCISFHISILIQSAAQHHKSHSKRKRHRSSISSLNCRGFPSATVACSQVLNLGWCTRKSFSSRTYSCVLPTSQKPYNITTSMVKSFFLIGMTMVAKAVANSCILNQKVVNPYYRVDELYMPLYENKLHTTWCRECISFLTVYGVITRAGAGFLPSIRVKLGYAVQNRTIEKRTPFSNLK